MKFNWVDGFRIKVRIDGGSVILSANREGLISLANQLSALARERPGCHFHLDEYNSLEEDSAELIIECVE